MPNSANLIRKAALLTLLLGLTPALPAWGQRPDNDKEPPPLKIRIYSSVTAGVSDSHARAFTAPLVNLVSREVKYPIDFDVAEGTTPDDLFAFGQDLDDGETHVGVVWGLEYGWLKEQFPDLDVLVVASQGLAAQGKCCWPTQLMVTQSFDGQQEDPLAELNGGVLAWPKRSPLTDTLFLMKQLSQPPQKFFGTIREYPTVKEAILAVNRGRADCVVVDALSYNRHVANQPNIRLRTLLQSRPFPEPALIGRRENVDGLRYGLWQHVESSLREAHRKSEGEQAIMFWRMDSFIHPRQQNYGKIVRRQMNEYPLSLLNEIEAPVND